MLLIIKLAKISIKMAIQFFSKKVSTLGIKENSFLIKSLHNIKIPIIKKKNSGMLRIF